MINISEKKSLFHVPRIKFKKFVQKSHAKKIIFGEISLSPQNVFVQDFSM